VSRTRFAASGDLQIAYELRGWGYPRRPVLVMIQGLGFDRTGWGPAVRRLQRRFRLVLIDNRGSGRSALTRGSFGVSDMCRDVAAVLDDIGVGTAAVMGASLGGMVAQDLAIRHPDRVDGLVLACTSPGWPFAYPMPMESVRLMAATRRLPTEVAARRLIENALSASTVAERPELVDRILAHQRAAGARPETWHAQAAAGARYVGSLRQRGIRARTLILHGAADRVVDPGNSRLLAERIAGSELVTLPGLGHLFFWEDPEAFARAVTAFLAGRSLAGWTGRDGASRPGRPGRPAGLLAGGRGVAS
jgi:3-oxoadipate enol-lactonase